MGHAVLVTGAAGQIGSFLSRHLAERYDLILTDVRVPEETYGGRFVAADIADLDAVRALCQGVDTVVHLAADSSFSAGWESLLPRNVIGVQHVFQAAQEAGCRRVIFASSIHAVAGYPPETQVHTDMDVRPLNLYGATKAWGEVLARFYADQRGISMICLRFGWVLGRERLTPQIEQRHLDIVLTYDDLVRLVCASIAAPDSLRFGIFHGVSDNRWKRLDISDARAMLGYAPEDDAFALAEAAGKVKNF